nr:autotransporter-associated N-terminal domain-containing protein [uncultured Leptotrichia sp.]
MTNNLMKLKKDLCTLAKKYRDFRYTDSALITFLITGGVNISNNLFSAEKDRSIENQKQIISASMEDFNSQVKEVKKENNKLMKNANMELIQLMEQGDHVVKSPWSSWQYGINGFSNKWNSTYKGRGDKSEKYSYEGVYERSSNTFERYTSPLSKNYKNLKLSKNINRASTNERNGLHSTYGLISNIPAQEPILEINVDASIKPKTVQIEIPDLGIRPPQLQVMTVNGIEVPAIKVPTPNTPTKTVSIAKPNAEPFTGFYFDSRWSHRELKDNISIYSGIDPASLIGNIDNRNPTPAAMTGSYNGRQLEGTLIRNENNRYTNAYYIDRQTDADKMTNNTFYLRGHYPTDTYDDSNTRAHLGLSDSGQRAYNDGHGHGIPDEGVVGVHALNNLKFKNLVFNLYGRAGAMTNETWRHGILDLDNVTVNMYNSDNMGFYNMPVARYTYKYWVIGADGVAREWRVLAGGFSGKANVNMYGRNNSVYLTTGMSYMKHWQNDGLIQSDGASNIVYSSFSYAPTLSKLVNPTGAGYLHNTNMIKLSNIKLYGDENIGMYFGSRIKGDIAKVHMEAPNEIESLYGYNNKAAHIGVYQGEIDFSAKVGEKLTIDNQNQQTAEGNLTNTGYTDKTVDGAVGIFSESGQRVGIVARGDIMEGPTPTAAEINAHKTDPAWARWFFQKWDGTSLRLDTTRLAPSYGYANGNDFSKDPIHNLEVAKLDIRFGNYSKNGIMVLSKQGTVIDVGKNTSNYHIIGQSTDITDGINGASTLEADASTGTIVAYSEGTWDQLKHRYGDDDTRIAKNDADARAIDAGGARKALTDATATTAAKLQGLPSEVNVYPNVVLASKEGIAYMGDNKGIVNAGTQANPTTTEAVNYKSIIGFARDEGTVNIHGNIEAIDKNATQNKFENIAGLATKTATGTSGGTVNIEDGSIKISGMAGFASGTGSVVNVNNGTANKIQTGENGALAAVDGGKVNFSGGTIYHEDKATTSDVVTAGTATADHSRSTPFYADSSSKIEFKGATTINMADGILMPGTDATNYDGGNTSSTAKYLGMNNVTVNLTGDKAVLRTYHGDTTNWTSGTTGTTNIKNDMQLAALNTNNHDYKIYYIDGIFNLNNNQDLDDNTDEFNTKIGLSNEKFTIASGVTVSSATGKGLSMASHDGVLTNATTGYTNNGTVNITGGTPSSTTALSTSFGYVNNNSTINVDKGIGAYGVNGSTLTNNADVNITLNGIGMAGFASASALKPYGTDDKISNGTLTTADKVLEITNNGTVTVAGDSSIGLYGNTNDLAGTGLLTTENGVITNNGKIVMTGDKAVGIVSEGAGNIINLGGTGSSDITVGTNGIGVYASGTQSKVNFTSNTGVEIKDKGAGIYVRNGSFINPNGNTFEIKYTGSANESGTGILYDSTATNTTDVDIVNTSSDKGIVGIYTTGGTLTNTGTITDRSGKAYGIYSDGANVINSGTLTMGDKGKGILSTGGDVTLTGTSVITVGENEAIGVYTRGTGNLIKADAGSQMTIGNSSYGFINEGTGNTVISNANVSNVGDNTVFVFSKDAAGTVVNNSQLTSTGSKNYGLYSAGTVINNANINYGSGVGNVGIYSINGGTASNSNGASITVGASSVGNPNPADNYYAIGMAAGYYGDALAPAYTGNILNSGTINVNGENSIGMYGTESGTTVTNNGVINLNASNTVGMYLDNGAYGINNGTIQSNGSGLKRVIGVVVKNGSTIENNGTIEINAEEAVGLAAKGNATGRNIGIIKNYGTLNITGVGARDKVIPSEGQALGKDMGGVKIHAPIGSTTATISVNGTPVIPELATSSAEEFKPMEVSTIGMYIDTSNKRFTRPITGLSELSSLRKADLIIGNEAAQNTTGKYIQVSPQILAPYNQMILTNPQIEKWSIYSGSLTWMASVAQNQTDGTIQNAYMAKIPYTEWAGTNETPVNKTDTYNFADGLEQRYGVEALGSRENQLFQKLNSIGNNEEVLLYQAFDEMMGHQYANVQQRINETGGLLDKEFKHLRNEWRTPTKDNNKIKVFGMKNEYKTDTAGIIDYTSDSYGVAYVHENETVKLGNSSGWYAGAVNNSFKFKDIGKSRENQTMLKAGIFKTMSPYTDHNGSLRWTVAGDVFLGKNEMKRRFLVVDDIFNAKSDYTSYGAAFKTDLGYDIRMSERTHLRPYGALKMEYGRFSNIKEDDGEVRLEVKGNDYFSVKPEAGIEFKYVQPMAVKTNLSVGLTAAYENELGKVGNVNNEARVRYTNADWFGIRGEKEDRRGNGKFDLNIGIDNTRFGVTVNAGYDTKGNNVRGGIGFRAIY